MFAKYTSCLENSPLSSLVLIPTVRFAGRVVVAGRSSFNLAMLTSENKSRGHLRT